MRINIKTKSFHGFIEIESNAYNAYEVKTIKNPEAKHHGLEVSQELGYCVSLDDALNCIIKKALADKDEIVEIETYREKLQKILDEFHVVIADEVRKLIPTVRSDVKKSEASKSEESLDSKNKNNEKAVKKESRTKGRKVGTSKSRKSK